MESMFSPNWQGAWNENGIVGLQNVYKFKNGRGALVNRTPEGVVSVVPIKEFGLEINNFVMEDTDPILVTSKEELEAALISMSKGK